MSTSLRRRLSTLLVLTAMAGIVGGVGPWIAHRTAGLTVGGFYLFEGSKFFPAVRAGAAGILREAFLLPVLISAVLLAWAPILCTAPRASSRWLCPLVAAGIVVAALPTYPGAHRDPEFQGQLALVGVAMILVLLSLLGRRLPARLLVGLAGGLAVVGLLLPLYEFARLRPLYNHLYGTSTGLGWGLMVYTAAMVAVIAACAYALYVSAAASSAQ